MKAARLHTSSKLGSRPSLTYRVQSTLARAQHARVASVHVLSVLRSIAGSESHELTTKLDDESEIERVFSARNAYSDEEVARLNRLLAEGKTFKDILPQFPGRSVASLRHKGRNWWGRMYWSQDEYDLLSKGMSENLGDLEIREKYLPSRSLQAIGSKRLRGFTPRLNAWSEVEDQELTKLREEGKSAVQIQKMALPHRSGVAITNRILYLLSQQKLKSRPRTYGYTDVDIQSLTSLLAQGLNNEQIAARLPRSRKSIAEKINKLGLQVNPMKKARTTPWTDAEDEILLPSLRKRLEFTELQEFLPGRSEAGIRRRTVTLRRREGIVLNVPISPWTPEALQELHSLAEERRANNGSPTWREISIRMKRSEGAVKTKARIIRDVRLRAELAQDPSNLKKNDCKH